MRSWTRTLVRSAICASLALTIGACNKEKPADAAKEAEAAKPVEKKKLETLFTGDKPVLVGPLAKLTLKQTGDEAKKAAPELFESKYGITDAEDYEGVSYRPDVDEKSGKLDRISVTLPKATALAAIKAAWGEPKDAKDSIGKQELTWFNPETGLRAVLKEGFGDDMDLEFTKYQPAKALLGEGKDKLGFEAKPLLGMTIEDLRGTFGDQLIEKSAADAKADRADLEKFAGKDLGALGEAKPNAYIELLPTEWESYWTRVNLTFDKENKVEAFRFSVAFEGFPTDKEPLLGLLKAKWGDPKEVEEYGRKKLVFNENPLVEVEDDDISKAWSISVEKAEAPAEAPAP